MYHNNNKYNTKPTYYYYNCRTANLLFKILSSTKIVNVIYFFKQMVFEACIHIGTYKVSFLNGTLIVVKIVLKIILIRVINFVFFFIHFFY